MSSDEAGVSSRSIEWLAWVEVHKRQLLVGAAVVAVLAGGVAIWRWNRMENERSASSALIELQVAAQAASEFKDPSASDYQRIASEHQGTRAARRAGLLAAEALFREGHYLEAKTQFERVLDELEDDSMAATAAYGIAASLEALGKTNEAVNAYQDVTLRHGTTGVATQARLALAGLQESRGEPAQALRSYSELTNAATSPWHREALSRIDSLLAQHPELAPTNEVTRPMPDVAPGTNTPSVGS